MAYKLTLTDEHSYVIATFLIPLTIKEEQELSEQDPSANLVTLNNMYGVLKLGEDLLHEMKVNEKQRLSGG